MKCTISQDKACKILEWLFFIGFIIVSGWFASGVLQQFFSNKTSFSQYEEKVTQYPAITIILQHQTSEVKTEDVFIKYATRGMQFQFLEIGENLLHNEKYNKTEKVILDSLQKFDGRKAFRIMQTSQILEENLPYVLILFSLNKNVTGMGKKMTLYPKLVIKS